VKRPIRDEELLTRFEDASLPLSDFHHAEHLRVAFLYLRQYPLLDVLARFPAALQRYAAAHGKAGLYHQTISWAFLFIVQERMAAGGEPGVWEEFAARNPDLLAGKEAVLKKYYRDETLESPVARERFLMPDAWLRNGPGSAN
jgi:hypothetical protein